MSPHEISHVSDTALMVAAARAVESDSPDAFIHDPFAGRLAGVRGAGIFENLPAPNVLRFGIAVRTRFIDELLQDALSAAPIETVLCLGCGLDTRPWRLELPPSLRWIEVDFAEMLDYKEALMAGDAPRCRRERIAADLNDPVERRAAIDAAGHGPTLMLTEGLLLYLPASTVEALAAEPGAVTHWISDITTAAFSKALDTLGAMRSVRHVQAPDSLEGEQILDVLHRHRWQTEARRSYITDMAFATERIQRMLANRPEPAAPPPIPPGDPTGIHRFVRPRAHC